MTEDASQGGLPRPSPLFQVATLPALLIGFRRRRIQASVLTDLVTFAGPVGQVTFAVLAVAAVLYPIVASLAHANVTAFTSIRNGTSAFDFAIFPLFDMVYAESLPFMAAAAVIGLFSPALGALFVAVFVPADLLAAGASGELATTPSQPGFSAVLARVISYVMLWFLAVEIPLLVRAIGDAVGTWTSSRSTLGTVAARVVAAGVLMLIWARSLPWVIVPVFTWSSIQVVQNLAIRPTWFYWQLLVAVAALAAGVAAFWPGFPASRPAEPAGTADPDGRPGSMAVILVRQTVAAVGLALLSAGLLTTITEAAVLAVGLLLIGPGVTLVAPRITMPAALTNAPEAVRWAIAIVVSTALAVLLLLVGGPGLYTGTYTGLLVVLTISGIAFRLLLGAATVGPPAVERAAPGVAAAVTTTLTMVSTLVLWLALPAIALADDCSDLGQGELTSCAQLLAAAALMPPIVGLLFGAAILNRAIQGPPPPPRKKTPPPPTFTGGRYVPGRGKQPGQYGPKPPPKSEEPPGFWDSLTKW